MTDARHDRGNKVAPMNADQAQCRIRVIDGLAGQGRRPYLSALRPIATIREMNSFVRKVPEADILPPFVLPRNEVRLGAEMTAGHAE
jgi:hypothetical protein